MLMQVMILYSSLSLIADTSSDQFVMDINLMGAFADFVKAWQEKNHAGDHSQGDVEASTILSSATGDGFVAENEEPVTCTSPNCTYSAEDYLTSNKKSLARQKFRVSHCQPLPVRGIHCKRNIPLNFSEFQAEIH